jgi:hypothetical protein
MKNMNFNQLTSYPPSKNRLLIVDWASLAYHQFFAIPNKKKHSNLQIETADDELKIWRSSMVNQMMKLVSLFNPMDILITKEGSNIWRSDYAKEYYNEKTIVYYDSSSYYIRYDNVLYKLYKENGDIEIQKMDIVNDIGSLPSTYKTLGELPTRVNSMIWNTKLPNGDPLMPKYKGKRNNKPWDFEVDRDLWKQYKEKYTNTIAGVFRAHVIGLDKAEGDDIVYVAAKYWEQKYDSIILVTRDSDFNQLLSQKNLKIYNHVTREMAVCANPDNYLEIKILMGDSSDNINGMALPNRKTKLGKGGAEKIFESGDYYDKAVTEGWEDQFKRNQKLINLNYIPTDIQRQICQLLDQSQPSLVDSEHLYDIGVNPKTADELIQMKNVGYYAFNHKEYIEAHPDIFNPDNFVSNGEQVDIEFAPVRTFDKIDTFDNPLGDEDIF